MRPLDTTIEIVTPENITFQYHVAGPFHRLAAYAVDLAIRFGVGIVSLFSLMLIFAPLGLPSVAGGAMLVIVFLLMFAYGPAFEAGMNGQTPGKYMMRLRVLSVAGQPINVLQAIVRNLLRIVDMQPGMFYLVGLVSAALNARFQRLGDLACGTMVVVEERSWLGGLMRVRDVPAAAIAAQLPANFVPERRLMRALTAYIGRRGDLSDARRTEVAAHLAELLRQRLSLPEATPPDLLLCAIYQRTMFAHENGAASATDPLRAAPAGESPFAGNRPTSASTGAFAAPSPDAAGKQFAVQTDNLALAATERYESLR